MERHEYDDLITHLVAIAGKQDALTRQQEVTNRRLEETMHDLKAFVQQQTVVNTQHTALIMRISRTLDRIEDKLGQLLRPPA